MRLAMLAAGILTVVSAGAADDDRKLPTVGMSIPVDRATDAPFGKAFREGLQEAGFVDGKNVKLISRYADGDPTRMQQQIRELIDLNVDVLTGDAQQLKE